MNLFKLGILLIISSILIVSCQTKPTKPTKPKKAIASISPTNLALSALINKVDTASIVLKNTGNAELNFSLTADASWLNLNKTSGVIQPNKGITLVAEASCGLLVEVRKAKISINSNVSNFVIPVDLDCSKAIASKGKLLVSISGLASGLNAKVTITAANSGFNKTITASANFDDLLPDTYTISADKVINQGNIYIASQSSQKIVVKAASSSSALVEYVLQDKEKGSLDISILGLRTNVKANIELIAANGKTIKINDSQVIGNLEIGQYSLKAKDIVPDSATFVANIKLQNIDIKAAETSSVVIDYRCSVVNIPDPILAKYLQEKLAKNSFNCKDLASLSEIYYGFQTTQPPDSEKISSIEGLQYATNLESLKLYSHVISSLPDNIFDNMSKLKSIWLFSNLLDENSVPSDIFTKLEQLEELYISNNQFKVFPENFFSSLKQLKRLAIFADQVTTISKNQLKNLNSLEQLELGGASLTSLSTNLLSNLPKLKSFKLTHSQIQSLPSSFFSHNPLLKTIDITDNKLVSLPDGLLANLSQLKIVSLRRNQITSISNSTFNNSVNIKSIYLRGNKLTNIGNQFTNLAKLYYLELSQNIIQEISNTAFDGLSGLDILILTDNKLSENNIGKRHFQDLTNLTVLALNKNMFTSLSDNLFDHLKPKLQSLYLQDNQLTNPIGNSITSFENLTKLSLQNNKLEFIPINTSPKLIGFHLSGNNIYDLTNFWRLMPETVKFLTLDNNCINKNIVPNQGYINDLEVLLELELSNNPRSDCPNSPTIGIVDYWFPDYNSWKIKTLLATLVNPTIINDYNSSETSVITFSSAPSLKPWYYRAGEHYYGDASAYAGEYIDLKIGRIGGNSNLISGPLILLKSSTGKLLSYYQKGEPPVPANTMTRYKISLSDKNDNGAWKINGKKATSDEIKEVLAKLSEILIRGKFYNDGDSILQIFKIGPAPIH